MYLIKSKLQKSQLPLDFDGHHTAYDRTDPRTGKLEHIEAKGTDAADPGKWKKDGRALTYRIDRPGSAKQGHYLKAEIIAERTTRGNFSYGATEYWKKDGRQRHMPLMVGGSAQTEEEAKAAIEKDMAGWALERETARRMPGWMHNSDTIHKAARTLHGAIDFNGLQVSIETGRSRVRAWHHPHDGSQGMSRMTLPYGYIKRTLGVDGDHYDCFVGPDRTAPNVYIITTMKAPDFTEIDEEKAVMGVRSAEEAKRVFFASYNDPRFFGRLTEIPFAEFKEAVLGTKDNPRLLGSTTPANDDMNEEQRTAYRTAALAAGADWNALIPEEFYAGMDVEKEHADLTGGDLVMTAKIALAHLKEDRRYYSKLETIEKAHRTKMRAGIYY